MEQTQKYSKLGIILGLIILGSLSRLLPHWPNFTALGAIALFGGSTLQPKQLSGLLTLGILLLTDLFIGLYSGMWLIYLTFLLISYLGTMIKPNGPMSVFTHSIGASFLFYLITNFGSWISSPFYSKDAAGLLLSYIEGIPFALNFTLGTLFFSTVLFGVYNFSAKRLQLTT